MRGLMQWLMRHRWLGGLGVLALTGALGVFAARVRPDYSVELLFPVWDPARQVYDRFKADFPYEDTRAVVAVEGAKLWTPEGIAALRKLEADLGKIPSVVDVQGVASARTLGTVDGALALTPVLSGAPAPSEIAAARSLFTTDPLFAWNVARPDGAAVSISLRLDAVAAGSDAGRQAFMAAARSVLAKHRSPERRMVLSGVPIIRARFAEMILHDVERLLPLALLAVLALLWLAFRSVASVLAAFATILVALVWTYGWMGLLGYPLTTVLSILPIIVIIISVSDTVHITSDFLAERRAGREVRAAMIEAAAATLGPCLLTEVVIACGFASLVAINIVAILQFGIAAAGAMLLVWLANATVLPLALSLQREGSVRPVAPAPVRWFSRATDRIGTVVQRHPKRIVAIAVLLVGSAAALGTRVDTVSYAFDDLRPGSQFFQEIRQAERAHGGMLPVALYIEPVSKEPNAALDPALLALADRGAAALRAFPEVESAVSFADYVRHADRAFGGAGEIDWATLSPRQLSRHVSNLEDPQLLREVLSPEQRTLAVISRSLDAGSERVEQMVRQLDEWIARERAAGAKAQIHVTGQLRIFKDVNDTLMTGLAGSFGGSLLVSFLVMCAVLRSWRLGLIGLVPNVAPVILVVAFMVLAGIALKPITVVVFSITLVIAEDDTIQLLARFRRSFHQALARAPRASSAELHREAALEALSQVGLPILLTSAAVSGGFFLLTLSEFLGPAYIGLLIGATLAAAVLADLFLTPLLLMKLQPFRAAVPAVDRE